MNISINASNMYVPVQVWQNKDRASQKAAVLKPVILKAAWKTQMAFNNKYFCGTMLTLKAYAHWSSDFLAYQGTFPWTASCPWLFILSVLQCHSFKSLILQTTKICCRSTDSENTALGIIGSSWEFRIKLVLKKTKTVMKLFLTLPTHWHCVTEVPTPKCTQFKEGKH